MKSKIIIVACLTLIYGLSLNAQKKEKIKGNKDVTLLQGNLETFSVIEILDDIKVNLIQSDSYSYKLKTDSNLIEFIKIQVTTDNVLKIYATKTISSFKELEIDLFVGPLKIIKVFEGDLISQNTLISDNLVIMGDNKTRLDLKVECNNLNIDLRGKSKSRINANAIDVNIVMIEKSSMKGQVTSQKLEVFQEHSSETNLVGSIESAMINIKRKAFFNNKKLEIKDAILNTSDVAKAYIKVTKTLDLEAKNKSLIELHGNPNINIRGLNDKTKIVKK